MAIDPTHLPIFGDADPADPPAPVRVASTLLLAHVAVTGGHLALLANASGQDLSLAIVPMGLSAWFALSVRAGRDWARAAALLLAVLGVVLVLGLSTGPVDLVGVALSMLLVTAAAAQMYRADVRDYFQPGESHLGEPDEVRADVAPDNRTRHH
ncbi:hypothetical protein [Actinokineospora sp. NBRC 105648]|uniref:hypothetical protein n=1 Tax=Actinokineospora sp. NBRC 105648 TaxID=3032206 RepID=UPI00249FB58D|nr:hypothetical protein [Actinokineospora sp. NBRC 105648]GLZ37183.1 hypothetical protein Acsp05_08080 [Actinokineospora sp. NBRC 105648]